MHLNFRGKSIEVDTIDNFKAGNYKWIQVVNKFDGETKPVKGYRDGKHVYFIDNFGVDTIEQLQAIAYTAEYYEMERFPASYSSLARGIQRYYGLDRIMTIDRNTNNFHVFDGRAVYGGRNEVYKYKHADGVGFVDFNSHYPACALDLPFVQHYELTTDKRKLSKAISDSNFGGWVKVKFRNTEQLPELPEKTAEFLLFAGHVKPKIGYFSIAELRRFNGCVIELLEGFVGEGVWGVFDNFIDDLFQLKKELKLKTFKLIINSFFGLFLGREISLEYHYEDGRKSAALIKRPKNNRVFGAEILGLGRARLYDILSAFDGRLVYCDTDGVYFAWDDGTVPNAVPLGDGLGEMSIDYYREIEIKHCRGYRLIGKDNEHTYKYAGATEQQQALAWHQAIPGGCKTWIDAVGDFLTLDGRRRRPDGIYTDPYVY